MRCEDPTNGELGRVRTIDLCLSRLVEPKEVDDLLARFPSDLISSPESPSALPSPLSQLHHHLHHSKLWGGGGREVSCPPSTDCSPKMSPLGMLSPSLSEDTVWLSSSGGGTPDHISRPYHQHPQQQVLTDAATDLMMRQQQRHTNNARDDDLEYSRNDLDKAVDDDRYFGSSNCNSTNSSNNDASASIMAILLMNHPKPLLSSPTVEKYQHPHFTPSQQQLYRQQQQQSLQFFTQRSVCSQSNPLGQDGAHNMLIQGIETCRGRVANSRPYQHRWSESDSGDSLVHGGGGLLSHGAEAQLTEQQQVSQEVRGKNQHGRRYSLQSQQQQQQQQYRQGSGNGGSGQRRKDQRRFSTSYQQKNFHHNQQHHHQQSYEVAASTSQDQHNVASSPVAVQRASTSLASQPRAVSEAILLQAPVSSRRRCISSGDFDPDPIAPIMPPAICSALRRRHTRRMSCDGRLETYMTGILEPQSSQPASESNVAATVKVSVLTQFNSHRLQQQQQSSNQNQSESAAGRMRQIRGRGRTQGPLMKEQTDAQYRSKRHSLTISTDFPKDSLRDTAMSSVSDAGSDRRASISSSISDVSISLSHSITLSPSSSSTSLSNSSSNGVCTRKGGPPVHYTLMCWIGGRWPCKLRPLIKKSTLNDIHIILRRNLKLAPSYYIDIEFEWQGQTYMIMDATHWQWAREQVQDGDMAIRCKIWQKRFAR
ncbi:hypothetical protein BGX30_013383 [Mortierella sp. GBA39]|nr:hypothetical protein BGX30_013383 [Mortierella sp. GBA39]